MTIETKYNRGDEVWVSLWDDPIKAIVNSMEILVRKERTYIFYNVEDVTDEFNCFREVESRVFSTKENLLKSL